MGTWVQQTSWSIVTYLIQATSEESGNLVWGLFSRLFAVPVSVLDDPTVKPLVQVLVGVVLGFLPVAIAWMALQETAARMDGTATTPPESLIRRGMLAALAVTGTSLVAWFMIELSGHARQLVATLGLEIDPLGPLFTGTPDAGIVLLILMLVFLVGSIALVAQRAVIMAETTVLIAIGPIMAAGLIREGGGTTWNIWLRELTSLLVSGLIQLLVTMLFLAKFTHVSPGSGGDLLDPRVWAEANQRMGALAYLWVLWNSPRWARHLVYSVGAGGAVVAGAANLTRMVVMRQIFKLMSAK
ncbi:MAG TPA: conjugal transfer protein TrbL family protein [Symbiobacteriaceae bacterium]|nr:conjugal transfer protein TrbL family protein [Symbiobacteriaceae bacterium]